MGPTLLIGLDGATFTILDPYVDRGVMPFLGEVMERGARAPLRSVMRCWARAYTFCCAPGSLSKASPMRLSRPRSSATT